MSAVAIALYILCFALIILIILEVRNFRSQRTLISRRRLFLRLAVGFLLMALIVAVFLGLFVLDLQSSANRPHLFLIYWLACVFVAFAIMWLMLADLQEVEDRFKKRQHEIWHDMARFVSDQMNRDGPTRDDPGKEESS